MKVFVLYFMGPEANGANPGVDWGKFIGVYSSQREALRAIERHQSRPCFSHYPKGLKVECIELDQDFDGSENAGPPPLI
jgi:hypothetical protein